MQSIKRLRESVALLAQRPEGSQKTGLTLGGQSQVEDTPVGSGRLAR